MVKYVGKILDWQCKWAKMLPNDRQVGWWIFDACECDVRAIAGAGATLALASTNIAWSIAIPIQWNECPTGIPDCHPMHTHSIPIRFPIEKRNDWIHWAVLSRGEIETSLAGSWWWETWQVCKVLEESRSHCQHSSVYFE